jgi:hypothetical protein
MTRRSLFGVLGALLLLVTISCQETPLTPDQRKCLAIDAGKIAALGYLQLKKPTKDQATAIKMVIDEIANTLGQYQDGGFIAALPKIKESIAKAFPNDNQKVILLMANDLAQTLLTELDALFVRHPDWKTLGGEVSGIVASFSSGASQSFADWLKLQ